MDFIFFLADESIELFYITSRLSKLEHFELQKYNLTQQTSKNRRTTKKQPARTLECNRFARIKGLSVVIDKTRRSNFSLSCNNPIRLHVLGMHLDKVDLYNFPKSLSVEVRHDIGSLVSFKSKIIFQSPFKSVVFFSRFFPLPSKRPNNEFVLHCFAEVDIYEFALGGKWITRFFFDK